MFTKLRSTVISVICLLAVIFSPVLGDSLHVQENNQDNSPNIIIEGPVQSINVNVITIADIDIAIDASEPLLSTIQAGDVVLVEGDLDNAVSVPLVQARSIVTSSANLISPVVTISGPVQAVNINIITIFNLNIQFNPNDPILVDLNVGDLVQVSGSVASVGGVVVIVPVQTVIIVNLPGPEATPEMTSEPEATPEPVPDDNQEPVTIVVEGSVQNININVITVFDFDVRVDPADPILVDLEVGDNIRVEGITSIEGDAIIIVAVHIVIINVVIVDQSNPIIIQPGLPQGCRRTPKGKIKCTRRSRRS